MSTSRSPSRLCQTFQTGDKLSLELGKHLGTQDVCLCIFPILIRLSVSHLLFCKLLRGGYELVENEMERYSVALKTPVLTLI